MKDPKPFISEAAVRCNITYYEAIVQNAKMQINKAQKDSLVMLSTVADKNRKKLDIGAHREFS